MTIALCSDILLSPDFFLYYVVIIRESKRRDYD